MCGQRSDFDTRPDPPLPLRGKPFDTKLRALSENFVAMDVAAIKRMPLGRFDMKTYDRGEAWTIFCPVSLQNPGSGGTT
jgi:hypothetical protein